MPITFNEVIELKILIEKKFGQKLHMHDTCSGQYFTFEAQIEGVEYFIKEYLAQKGVVATFAPNGLSFTIE